MTRTGARARSGTPVNPATRAEAHALLADALARHVAARRRVLVACDFAYAYPRGFAPALGLRGPRPRWERVWDELARLIEDAPTNANNRWTVAAALNRRLGIEAGPFWACPGGVATTELCIGKGRFPHRVRRRLALAEYRLVDARLRGSGRLVQSVWKLFTTGSVGSQTLLGIPRLHALRRDPRFAALTRVWPFETGFSPQPSAARGPLVVHAEAWPRIVPEAGRHPVLDARQVMTLARYLAARDASGELGALFDRPRDLDDAGLRVCLQEEGWVVGA